MGGKGVISVLANIMPRATHDIVAAFLAGNVEESRRRQLAVNALVRTLFCEVNPIPVKRAVALMGFDVGALRLPLTPLEAEHEERLRCEMQALQLI
jgi:Dihydrodipicolinate synthase/N-acetylneuraminate lyase